MATKSIPESSKTGKEFLCSACVQIVRLYKICKLLLSGLQKMVVRSRHVVRAGGFPFFFFSFADLKYRIFSYAELITMQLSIFFCIGWYS